MYVHTNKCEGVFIGIKIDEDTTMEDIVEYLMCNPPYINDNLN